MTSKPKKLWSHVKNEKRQSKRITLQDKAKMKMQEFLSELGEQSDIADLTYIRKQQQKALFDH